MTPTAVYLDHNATAPPLPAVREAVCAAMERLWANPHSPHRAGRAAAEAVEAARERVAALVGRPARHVRFTSGATEANAWALRAPGDAAVLVSAVEHPSALAWGTHRVAVDSQGRLDLDGLDTLLRALGRRVAVVSVMAANHETGVLQPLAEVVARCRAAGVPVHCDATQLAGRLPVRLDADLLTISAHKLGGPRGVGALVCAEPPPSLLRGGPQERGARAGTVPVPLVVGFGEAAAHAAATDPRPVQARRDRLEAACRRLGGRIASDGAARLPNTCAALFEAPGDLVVMGLDLEGVAASTGAACASGAAEDSPVLRAMGLVGRPVRFSLGPGTTDSEIDRAIAALERVLARIRAADLEGLPA